jgi:hypothetical protein
VTAFALLTRLSTRLTGFLMSRMGFDSQITRDPEIAELEQPTLFAPSDLASPVHGPFEGARRHSSQLWLISRCSALAGRGQVATAAALRTIRRPASP